MYDIFMLDCLYKIPKIPVYSRAYEQRFLVPTGQPESSDALLGKLDSKGIQSVTVTKNLITYIYN